MRMATGMLTTTTRPCFGQSRRDFCTSVLHNRAGVAGPCQYHRGFTSAV